MIARLRLGIAALTLLALFCGKHEKPLALTTISANLNPNLNYAPLVMAKEEGYFREEGIDVSFVTLDANSALLAVSTGKLDVLSGPVRSGLFNLIVRGVPLQVVADRGHSEPGRCASEAFAAPVATAERIARTRSFRHERFAIIRGGITEYLIERILEREHLTPADVQFVQLPQGDYTSSVSRQIDAIRYTLEPNLSSAIAKGLVKPVVTMEEIAPGHQFGVLAFGKRLLHDDPALGRRFMRAYLRGVRRYNEGKTERNVAIVAKFTKLPPDIVKRACWQTVSIDGRVRAEAVQPLLAWARKRGYLEADVPTSAWWNSSFVDAAAR